ncbi:MAG: transmembrane anchor protein [Proteobacteria bacterium]|nr:transmembrane anchor protein [Pseudomonadota bacterium]
MYNSNIPSQQELPSTGKLIKSTIIAAVAAGILLVAVVLPAEYGIDPTGIGKSIGLTKMGEIKVSLAQELANETAVKIPNTEAAEELIQVSKVDAQPATSALSHEMKVTLAPDEGTEIKVAMSKESKVQYKWWTDGGKANFDTHADSKKLNINYHSYNKGSKQKSEGTLVAAFDGSHGWFWRNRTPKTMIITLIVNGDYTDIKHFK